MSCAGRAEVERGLAEGIPVTEEALGRVLRPRGGAEQPATNVAWRGRGLFREVQAPPARLMPREPVVLATLADGPNAQAIAERLFISLDTAQAHVVRVLGKLGAESRLQAAIFAMQHGIGSPP